MSNVLSTGGRRISRVSLRVKGEINGRKMCRGRSQEISVEKITGRKIYQWETIQDLQNSNPYTSVVLQDELI